MFDEPFTQPVDFDLAHPLPSNTDQSLLLSAHARWEECHAQWLELMAQSPRSPLDEHWWSTRARGTDLSRRAQATRLYRHHFEASCQWAYAQGHVTGEQMNALLPIIEPALHVGTTEADSVRIERPALGNTEGRQVELSGAWVIGLDSTELLYLPCVQPSWMSFSGRQELERWLIEQQPHLFNHLRLLTGTVRVDYTVPDKPVLQAGAESLLAGLSIDVTGRKRNETALAPPPERPETDTSALVIPFGQLSPDIPLNLRHSALAQQQAALDSLLGKDFQGHPEEPRLLRLQQQLDTLAAAEQAANTAATLLLQSDNALKMLELTHSSNPHYPALYQARLSGLRAEAQLQSSLNQINPQEHRWLSCVLDNPAGPPPDDVVVARLILTGAEGDDGEELSEELVGVLLFAHPNALLRAEDQSLLLYWPGRQGGLQRFASQRDMEQTLFKRSANDTSLSLQILALSGNPFEYALQSQLYRCEQQAARLIADNPVPSRASLRAVELEKLREQTLARLAVPTAAARELAFAQLVQQNQSSALARHLPTWHGVMPDAQRKRLKALFTSCIKAMKRSHELLERELPHRDDFGRKLINSHLRQAFGIASNVEVVFDLPVSTSLRREIADQHAGPGIPFKHVLIPSQQRSKLSLVEFAFGNINDEIMNRLAFMKIEISGGNEGEREKLKNALTQQSLRKLATELDLAGKYEARIRETFLGTSTEPAFSNEHRRECLSEPWRLMLKLQGEFAVLQRDIDGNGQRLLDIAIDADSRQAYTLDGKNIALLPAHLSVGGSDTPGQGPSTLSGVTFIVEHNSGLTLLYLPDSPDGTCVRQFDSLERARKALFNLCLRTDMANYLANRAVHGDIAQHVGRINQALLKHYDALIGIGPAWPATTSLAAHLVNCHMGRLLQAHRATSRSNDALYLEQAALKSGAVFNYLKMALGMVPFVGAAVALYDAWNSANLAVAAFLRGKVGHGLAEVEAVLLSLIDAAMDILPGASVAPGNVRGITRHRQLRALAKHPGALQVSNPQQARRTLERFKGYEYEYEISLAGLQPANHGVYRNVYRHNDGDFMISNGRLYRIELDADARQWRLSGTWARPYKQPIALDEAGNWNTHYAVYGTIIEGGGTGGGGVLGHMADGLDPLWPAAIREWLPRWWTDRGLRRQLTLTNTADALTRQLATHTKKTNGLLDHYYSLERGQRQPYRAALDSACQNDIEIAQNQYRTLEELKPLTHSRKRVKLDDIQSRCAWIVVDRSIRRIDMIKERLLQYLDRLDQLSARSNATPPDQTAVHLNLMAQRKPLRKTFLTELDQQHLLVEQANNWNARITFRAQKTRLADDMALLNKKLNDANYYYLKTAHSLETVARYEAVDDLSWLYFHTQFKTAQNKMGRSMLTQHHLPDVHSSATQRNRVVEDCLTTYAEFRRNLQAWTLGYPQHLDLEQVAVFLDNLQKLEELARHAIKHRAPVAPDANSPRRLFETEDNQLLIGIASTDTVTRQQRFTLEGVGQTETWLPRNSGKYHLSGQRDPAQPQLPDDVQPLLAEARGRLVRADAYKNKVEGYAQQNMLPIDLEHMMSSEAMELSNRARAIERLLPTDPLVLQLRNRSDTFLRTGRTLRIEQSLNSKTPTEGYLDYLLQQRVVDIRREGALRDLGKRADGRRDFLQEYEVRDLTMNPPRPLWYAHFHYNSAKPQFGDFVKGHLKLPEQRNLGLQWQQAQASSGATVDAIWRGDIGKPLGIKHFSEL
ncbi:dermonecrotic toxin domain-containing protein [Pseudomonas sp. NPDC089569]|uniref:dermonecrotic toxin domain-containing protein n=1 Tax=Pseudomonas sp. NPDC089569 TaxID=3390722 RepID=UPI003D042AA3